MEEQILYCRIYKGWHDGIIMAKARLVKYGGDSKAHFSITSDNGCDHDTIQAALGHLDEIKLLISLHLSDEDGAPIHAVDNSIWFIDHAEWENARQLLRISDADLVDLIKQMDSVKTSVTNEMEQKALGQCLCVPDATRHLIKEEVVCSRREKISQIIDEKYRARWREEAKKAISYLKQMDYSDPILLEHLAEDDPRTNCLLMIDGEMLPCSHEYDNEVEVGPAHHYAIFQNSEEAGKAAREYWKDMAENSPKEFTYVVGEETLIQWGLGRPAGLGGAQASSLEEWLDTYLDVPEDHFASYDGKEIECKISRALAEELGIAGEDMDADDPENSDWIDAVAYRQ